MPEASSQAKILTQARPPYPESARHRGIQGMVAFRAVIGVDGVPHDLQLVCSAERSLDTAAREAVD